MGAGPRAGKTLHPCQRGNQLERCRRVAGVPAQQPRGLVTDASALSVEHKSPSILSRLRRTARRLAYPFASGPYVEKHQTYPSRSRVRYMCAPQGMTVGSTSTSAPAAAACAQCASGSSTTQ